MSSSTNNDPNRMRMESVDDISTVDESAGYIDTNSTFDVSRLGMGGVSTMGRSSMAGGGTTPSVISEAGNTLQTETTQGTFGTLQELAWKVQHHVKRYFFPHPPVVTRRKKFDRTDSDDLEELLEEGTADSSLRKRGSSSRSVSSGYGDDDNNMDDEHDDTDYYGSSSRGMSSPNHSPRGKNMKNNKNNKKKSRRNEKKKTSTAQTIGLFFLMTATITIYRMPSAKDRRRRATNPEDQFAAYQTHPPIRDGSGQVYDHTTGAMVDSIEYERNNNIDLPNIPRSGNNAIITAEVDALDAMDKQYLFQGGDIQLPTKFDALADVDDLLFQKGIDVPFYWHVPRSGGGTMNDILGR